MNTDELTIVPSSGDGTEIRVTLARFEAKLDVALAHHGAKIETHDREIATLRSERKEHDLRLLTLERSPSVSPRALAVVVAGVVGALGALAPFIDRLYS